MKRREKILAGGLLIVVALWQAGGMVQSFIFQPVEDRENRINDLQEQVRLKEKQLRQSQAAARHMKELKLRSLPPEPVVAQSLYQNWLVSLATEAKLSEPAVIMDRAETRPVENTYYLIKATMSARGTLGQLVDFLYKFRQSGLLHRVARMDVSTDRHQPNPTLDIKLAIEGLSLLESPQRTTLLADEKLADLPGASHQKDAKEYAPLLAKNLFVRTYNGPPRPPGRPDDIDEKDYVYLSAAVDRDGALDAYLYDRAKNKITVLTAGALFDVAGVSGKVVQIALDHVLLEIHGEQWRLDLGKNLKQLEKSSASVQAGSLTAPESPRLVQE